MNVKSTVVLDGQPTGSIIEAKFRQAAAALRGGSHFGALIAIATDVADNRPDESILPKFLGSVHAIPGAAALPRG
jgi:hypothetical protein